MKNHLLSADSIMNDSVKNNKGEDIGSIKELMVDPQDGRISYAVLSFGGFMGMGDKYFAVPWDALEIDRADKVIRLDITKERLEHASGFDKNDWPDFADPTFAHTVNKSFDGVGRHTYTMN